MSEVLKKFSIIFKIDEILKKQIKLFHVFDEQNDYNLLFVTNDDKVYGFGKNSDGCCGFGHNRVVNKPQVIPELCYKSIKQFFTGKDFVLAINHDNQLYGWGRSDKGQLGCNEQDILKPFKMFEIKEELIDISCGTSHCLALTSNSKVYGWGNNSHGQIGCGQALESKVLPPILLENISKYSIKSIHCISDRSYVLTIDGRVYSWGLNKPQLLGHTLRSTECIFEPTLINISNIVSICLSKANTYFLTNKGLIYFCGKYNFEINGKSFQEIPKLLDSETCFTSLQTIPYNHRRGAIPIALTDSRVFILFNNKIENTIYGTLIEFISEKYKVTQKTIDLNKDRVQEEDKDKKEDKQKDKEEEDDKDKTKEDIGPIIMKEEKLANPQNRYKEKFNELCELGRGGFGQVFKVQYKTDQQIYAVKKIVYDDEDDNEKLTREVKTLIKCKSDYVVKYIDWWPEYNNKCIYIQMELCADNLDNIIKLKSECFGRQPSEPMTAIEYFISLQLFKELLECVQYLHESDPPIIHRDLKPANVLIREMPTNKRFLKLCDFGLAKCLDSNTTLTQTRFQGTQGYMAPEVINGSKYSIKADIYTMGKLAERLFDIDINGTSKEITIGIKCLKSKGKKLKEKIKKMLVNAEYNKRPSCAELLKACKKWEIDLDELKSCSNYNRNVEMMRDFKNNFFNDYFFAKSK